MAEELVVCVPSVSVAPRYARNKRRISRVSVNWVPTAIEELQEACERAK